MKQFFFPIGMPKAASSYLQKNYFPLLELDYLGKHYSSPIDFKEKNASDGNLAAISSGSSWLDTNSFNQLCVTSTTCNILYRTKSTDVTIANFLKIYLIPFLETKN